MGIVTVSRQMGSSGTEICEILSKKLNYKIFDKDEIERELKKDSIYDLKNEIEKFDEKKPTLKDGLSAEKLKYLHFLRSSIFNIGKDSNCIIIGRGSREILKGIPGVLHMRIISDMDARVSRVKEMFSLSEKEAEKIINHSDHERSGFHSFFFNVEWSSCSNYDLIINSSKYSLEGCADIISCALKAVDDKRDEDKIQKSFDDLVLSEGVFKKILYEELIPVWMLDVKADDGVVTLYGTVSIKENIELCRLAAEKVSGVNKVVSDINFVVSARKRLT